MKFLRILIASVFLSALLFPGNLNAQVETGGNAVDDTEFTIAIDEVTPVGYMFDDTAPDSIDEDDVGIPRMSANRNTYMTIRDGAGNERGVNVTASNELSVNCANCTGSGVSHIDDAVFTATTDDIAPMGALFDASPPSITDGNAGIPRMSDLRYLIVDLTELDGNAITLNEGTSEAGTLRITIATDDVLNVVCDSGCAGGAQFAVDDALGATPTGTLSLGRRDAVLSALTPVDDDAVAVHIDGFGSLWSALTADDGARIPADSTAGLKVDLGIDNDVTITGTVTTTPAVVGGGTEAAAQRVTIANDSTGLISVDDNGANLSIDWAGVVPPIGAGTEAAALRVTVATDSTGVLSIDDNGGELTVNYGSGTFLVDGSAVTQPISGTVTANAGTDLNTSALLTTTNFSDVLGTASLITSAVLGEAVATTQDVLNVRNFNYVFNGTTFDFIREGSTAGSILVDGSGVTQPISAASLPLPTGAATSTSQLADGHNVTIDNAAGVSAVNIQDGGNVITIDGTLTTVTTVSTVTDATNWGGAAIPLTTTQADNLVNTLDGLNTTSFLYGFDGSAWDRLLATAGVLRVICDSGCAGGAQFAVDDALGATPTGTLSLARRDAILSALTPIDDDAVALHVDGFGSLWGALSADNGARIPADATAGLKVDLGADNDINVSQLGGVATPVTTTQADDRADTLDGLNTSAFMYAYDEASGNWDRLRQYIEGGAAPASFEGTAVLLTRDDSIATHPVAEGNLIAPRATAEGARWTQDFNSDAMLASLEIIDDMISGSEAQVDVITFPANQPFNQAQVGGVARVLDPCKQELKLYISIDQTSNTQYVTGTASERIYICSFNIVTNGAEDVAVVSGTGSVCGTSTAGVPGLTGGPAATDGWQLAANGGIVTGSGESSVAETDTDADNLCILQTGSGQLSGGFTYVSL